MWVWAWHWGPEHKNTLWKKKKRKKKKTSRYSHFSIEFVPIWRIWGGFIIYLFWLDFRKQPPSGSKISQLDLTAPAFCNSHALSLLHTSYLALLNTFLWSVIKTVMVCVVSLFPVGSIWLIKLRLVDRSPSHIELLLLVGKLHRSNFGANEKVVMRLKWRCCSASSLLSLCQSDAISRWRWFKACHSQC